MISFILTAWKEEKTIGKAIRHLVDRNICGYSDNFELLLVAPDKATKLAAEKEVRRMKIESKFRCFKDQAKGKPLALNILFKEAKGEILVLTDGEVFFEKNAVAELLDKLNSDSKIGIVSGHPIALNNRKTYFGYLANMNADAVHHMRLDAEKTDTKFFPASGYIMAIRNFHLNLPGDLFLDDAYITYKIFNKGYKVGYAPEAKVKVKYPTNWKDFEAQKFRSLIGFEQLWKYKIIKEETKTRTFRQELSYAMFPIRYASNLRELVWSFTYYPIRLYFWIRNRLRRDLAYKAKSIRDVYVRTESTK